jgi:molybdenum cofactor biosynthesis enzyme MoaA
VSADQFGRNIHYLGCRLPTSATACVYCMAEDMVFCPGPELMQDDERSPCSYVHRV